MAWDLGNKIQPPNPQTNKYGDEYEVMATRSSLSGSVGGFNGSHRDDIRGLGNWQNDLINPDNVPAFDADAFSDPDKGMGGLFKMYTEGYRESFLGTSGPGNPLTVKWEDQKRNRGGLNQQFVTETKQNFEDFAQDIGVDMTNTNLPSSTEGTGNDAIFNPWRLNWVDTSVPSVYDENVHPENFDTLEGWSTPDYFSELARDPATSTNTGAGLTYDRAIEDANTTITDAQEDALTTLENTEEDLNREQADQQRQFIESLRTGKAAQGITGVRTGRDFRRTMPATKNIALSREAARQEYDKALDRSVTDADKAVERADQDLNNAIMAGILGLKNKLEIRKGEFHYDDTEDEAGIASDIMIPFGNNTNSPAPWPGKCPSGQHMNEAGDTCVDDI